VVALTMVNAPVHGEDENEVDGLTAMVDERPTNPVPVIVNTPVPAAGQFCNDADG